jgi:hypothetical protein
VADRPAARPAAPGVLGARTADDPVQALPGHRSVFLEVRGNDPDDGVADFADGLKGKSLRLGSVLAGLGLVWHAQIDTQHIDAGPPVFLPVISQARDGVHPS